MGKLLVIGDLGLGVGCWRLEVGGWRLEIWSWELGIRDWESEDWILGLEIRLGFGIWDLGTGNSGFGIEC